MLTPIQECWLALLCGQSAPHYMTNVETSKLAGQSLRA